MTLRILIITIIGLFSISQVYSKDNNTPFGSSRFVTFSGVKKLETLKVVFDFNFKDPAGVQRALYPVSFTIKTVQEYGPVSFEPYDIIVVSHGSEVVAFARQNYKQYKEIVDHAARLAELGVKFQVCSVAAAALGFGPDDFHGFVQVVPTGAYALMYHQNQGYALIPGAATVPVDLINSTNKSFLGEKSDR
jgi:intracellular sulfur oxidation DsrE/DsrF family protein